MAMKREDYKYVYNSFNKSNDRRTSEGLKIGSTVKNLLEIREDNIVKLTSDDREENFWYVENEFIIKDKVFVLKLKGTPVEGKNNLYTAGGILDYKEGYVLNVEAKNLDSSLSEKAEIFYEGIDENNTRCEYKFYSSSPIVDGVFKYQERGVIENTIQFGALISYIKLKADTNYVLQVINTTNPNPLGENYPINSINAWEKNINYNFNSYLFFRTPAGLDIDYDVEINGLSFGYPLEDRSFKSPLQGKVFLFESDLPWMVDDSGTIIGLSNEQLSVPYISTKTRVK